MHRTKYPLLNLSLTAFSKLLNLTLPRRLRPARAEKIGIRFGWQSDEIIWIWPWTRNRYGHRFVSLGFNASFKRFKEIKDLWLRYEQDIIGRHKRFHVEQKNKLKQAFRRKQTHSSPP